jgi:hypothetical protein
MKLITKEESNSIFDKVTSYGNWEMTEERFNEAVNFILLDGKINKKLLQRVKKIKDNPNLLDKELKDYFDNNHKL